MADPRWKIQTIRYKTYLKESLVEALRNVFSQHPDTLLRQTKVDIDFPTTQADFPAVVVRFFEREIRNAGVAHEEWFETFDITTRAPLFTDPYDLNNSVTYEIHNGTYPIDGIIPLNPWIARSTAFSLPDRIESIVKVHWNGEPIHIGQLLKATTWDNLGVYCVARFNENPGKMELEIWMRRGTSGDELIISQTIVAPVMDEDYYILARIVDDSIGIGVYKDNPVAEKGPITQLNWTITPVDLASLTSNDNIWIEAATSQSGNTSFIDQYSINELSTQLARGFHKFKHLIYTGDVELAIYALSSLDRDLVADTIVEVLMMAELELWTNELLDRIYNADPTLKPTATEHFININTDKIGPFGESQSPVPWEAEDQLIYNVSYRIPTMGELYSRVPANKVYGLVERVDTFPYQGDLGEPVPNPHPEDPQPWH